MVGMILSLETDLIVDAARDLTWVYQNVRLRQGDAFRALERRLEALVKAEGRPVIHWLDDGIAIAAPPAEWTAILAEATHLEVI